jgi:hypothetical protein
MANGNGSHFFKGSPTVLIYPGRPMKPEPGNVVQIDFTKQDGSNGTIVPVFVSEGHASQFVSAIGQPLLPLALSGFDALEQMLVQLSQNGVTHVQFNAMPPGHDSPEPIAIAEVIDSLRSRPKQ